MNIVIYVNVKHLQQCLVCQYDCKKCFNFLPQVIPSTKRYSPGTRKLTLRHRKPITRQTFSNKGNITITTRETKQPKPKQEFTCFDIPYPGGRSGKWNALQVAKPEAVSGPTGRQTAYRALTTLGIRVTFHQAQKCGKYSEPCQANTCWEN